ncbi:MAG TPA: DHHA1 domain-containing protein, partial [Deinococcales bacterium]|nr:DHHA1 domain-containing protein [Deinococcales bacterium]
VTGTVSTADGLHLHSVRVLRGELKAGTPVDARVDPARRETEKNHSATHLLHAALREVLGSHVTQAGSLVSAGRLRFDFSSPEAPAPGELARVEQLVNDWIARDLPVSDRTVSMEEARREGAMMLFGEKYGDEVRLVSIGDVSKELCGGTHVGTTGLIGPFVFTEETAVAAGTRRIEARTGKAAIAWLQERRHQLEEVASGLGVRPEDAAARVTRLQADLRELRRNNKELKDRLAAAQTQAGGAAGEDGETDGISWAVRTLDSLDAGALRNAADTLLQQPDVQLAVLASGPLLVVKASKAARERGVHAGNLVRALAEQAGGRGGGRPDMAQAGAQEELLPAALESFPELLRQHLSH